MLEQELLHRTAFVILAAGLGKRMHSAKAKAMQLLAGRPMIDHLVQTLESSFAAGPKNIFVVVHAHKQQIIDYFEGRITPIDQGEALGTAHALGAVMPHLKGFKNVVVLYGDVPLIRPDTIRGLLRKQLFGRTITILTALVNKPDGYGRIIRNSEDVITEIVEEADANNEQRKIHEINTGIMSIQTDLLSQFLPKINNHNSQGEYYLTSIVSLLASERMFILNVLAHNEKEVLGANDMEQLHGLEEYYQKQLRTQMMRSGLRILHPESFSVLGHLSYGQDCLVQPNVLVSGRVKLGNRVTLGANSVIIDSEIGDDAVIAPFTLIDKAKIGSHAVIGPYARIRPQSHLDKGVKVGNFVELKNVSVKAGTKISHLSYLGDTSVGEGVNIGAGTVTCNYDGHSKHLTHIGSGSFIGSNTTLVAPIEVGKETFVAAGSTLTEDVSGGLVVARTKQVHKPKWAYQKPKNAAKASKPSGASKAAKPAKAATSLASASGASKAKSSVKPSAKPSV